MTQPQPSNIKPSTRTPGIRRLVEQRLHCSFWLMAARRQPTSRLADFRPALYLDHLTIRRLRATARFCDRGYVREDLGDLQSGLEVVVVNEIRVLGKARLSTDVADTDAIVTMAAVLPHGRDEKRDQVGGSAPWCAFLLRHPLCELLDRLIDRLDRRCLTKAGDRVTKVIERSEELSKGVGCRVGMVTFSIQFWNSGLLTRRPTATCRHLRKRRSFERQYDCPAGQQDVRPGHCDCLRRVMKRPPVGASNVLAPRSVASEGLTPPTSSRRGQRLSRKGRWPGFQCLRTVQ